MTENNEKKTEMEQSDGNKIADLEKKKDIMHTLDQKSLIKLYAKYVNKPKATFFKSLGLGLVQGERNGIYLRSLEGPRKNKPPVNLIDCRTSGGVFNLGHANPIIIQTLKDALDAGLDIGDHHMISEQRALLAKELADLLPGDISVTQFCVSGGEAIDLAIKLARAATKKTGVISAIGGYHGVTGLALGAGDPRFKDAFLWHPKDYKQVVFGDIDSLRNSIDENTACVIFESIPATGGILIPPEGYFAQVREICDEHGIIMIQDEVQTGLGRTGELWAVYGGLYKNEKVVPDIMVLAKGMSGGIYPMATTSYKPYIGEVFEQDPFLHISTTGGAELGCYVTRKVLQIQSDPKFLAHVREMGSLFNKRLEELKEKYTPLINEVRGRGLMWGVEFISDRYGIGYTLHMIENGVFADYCGNNEKTIKLMPPLVINKSELDETVKRLDKALSKLPMPKDGS